MFQESVQISVDNILSQRDSSFENREILKFVETFFTFILVSSPMFLLYIIKIERKNEK